MASRYLPRRSAGKKAVALTVLFVTGAASGVVTVAAAGTAVAASTTHAIAYGLARNRHVTTHQDEGRASGLGYRST